MKIKLNELLEELIIQFFPNHIFTLKGSLEWYPTTEKQKERHFKKFGKELKPQKSRYKIKQVFWEGKTQDDNVSSHHQIVISEIEKDGVFYIMNDHKVERMGQTFRYKFKIIDYLNLSDYSKCKYELLDKRMIMIR